MNDLVGFRATVALTLLATDSMRGNYIEFLSICKPLWPRRLSETAGQGRDIIEVTVQLDLVLGRPDSTPAPLWSSRMPKTRVGHIFGYFIAPLGNFKISAYSGVRAGEKVKFTTLR
jgi:hypothetical protein